MSHLCVSDGVHLGFHRWSPGDGTLHQVRGILVSVLGWALLLVGIVMFPLPGPGLLVIAAGLTVLAREHDWARRRLDRVRLRALYGAALGVRTTARAAATIVITLGLGASGLLWLWAPPVPPWWVLPAWTWLPGGVWSGVGQLVSGVIALAVVLHGYYRFHGRADQLAELGERLRRLD